jgi:CBS domain-containing protein
MEERREEATVHVEDAMRAYQGSVLKIETPLKVALAHAVTSSELFVLVEDGTGKWYGIKKEEMRRRAAALDAPLTLRGLLPEATLPYLHPDQGLDEALRRIGDWPLLPVVSRADFRKLEGVVSLTDILEAYREAPPEAGMD